jgi:hypothetical protein
MSRFDDDPGPVVWTLPAREVVVVLEAEARIEVEEASTIMAQTRRHGFFTRRRPHDLASDDALSASYGFTAAEMRRPGKPRRLVE